MDILAFTVNQGLYHPLQVSYEVPKVEAYS